MDKTLTIDIKQSKSKSRTKDNSRNITRKVAMLIFLLAFGVLSLIPALQIDDIISFKDDLPNQLFHISMVMLIWTTAYRVLKQVGLAYSKRYWSYIFATLHFLYLVVFVIINNETAHLQRFSEVGSLFFWTIPTGILFIAQKFVIYIIERRVKPQQSKAMLLSVVQSVLAVAMEASLMILFDGYWKTSLSFDFSEMPTDESMLVAIVFVAIVGIALITYLSRRFFKKDSRDVSRVNKMMLYDSAMKLIVISIWFGIQVDGTRWKSMQLPEYIMLATTIITGVLMISYLFMRTRLVKSRVSLALLITGMFVVTTLEYLLNVAFSHSNEMTLLLYMIPSLTSLAIMMALSEPKMPKFFAAIYSLWVYWVAVFAISIAFLTSLIQGVDKIPLDISLILGVPALIVIVIMEFIVIFSANINTIKLSRTTNKVVKIRNERNN